MRDVIGKPIVDLNRITKIIFVLIGCVFVSMFILLFVLIFLLAKFVGPAIEQATNPPYPTISITPCQNYPANFIGPIRPCDTRGGKHEYQVTPTK